MRVLMVASEAAPYAKTGGLGDVVGALPRALAARGVEAAVVVPRYRSISISRAQRVYHDLPIRLGRSLHRVDIYSNRERGFPCFLVDCPPLYDRDGLYGANGQDFPDNHQRFALLAQAALGIVRHLFRPHVLHCHDWQAALVPVYMRHLFSTDPTFFGLRTLFTIHNLGYPGLFDPEILPEIGLDESALDAAGLEFFGRVNLLKGGIVSSDWINTVSPTYSREIQTPELGFGLDDVLRARTSVLSGILNGADYAEWNPETDPHIAANYTADDLSGKQASKLDLLAEFGLPRETSTRPLIGIVSRFASQKGFDLIAEAADELAREDLALVALGTGEPKYEQMFADLAQAHPASIAVRVAYDDRLAHKIEAGADMFLMPSRYEPCGLSQIHSLRYGTVPIVRATGGLADTVDESIGVRFVDYSGQALLAAVRAALAAFRNPDEWRARLRRGMAKDYSWDASAGQYAALYDRLAERPA